LELSIPAPSDSAPSGAVARVFTQEFPVWFATLFFTFRRKCGVGERGCRFMKKSFETSASRTRSEAGMGYSALQPKAARRRSEEAAAGAPGRTRSENARPLRAPEARSHEHVPARTQSDKTGANQATRQVGNLHGSKQSPSKRPQQKDATQERSKEFRLTEKLDYILAVGAMNSRIVLLDASNGEERLTLAAPLGNAGAMCFSKNADIMVQGDRFEPSSLVADIDDDRIRLALPLGLRSVSHG